MSKFWLAECVQLMNPFLPNRYKTSKQRPSNVHNIHITLDGRWNNVVCQLGLFSKSDFGQSCSNSSSLYHSLTISFFIRLVLCYPNFSCISDSFWGKHHITMSSFGIRFLFVVLANVFIFTNAIGKLDLHVTFDVYS